MPAIPHVVRRGAAYYWRLRIPNAIAESRKSANLILSLRTTNARRARFLATQISALADLYLFPALMNKPLTRPQALSIFRGVFTRHLDKLERHLDKLEIVAIRGKQEADFDPDVGRSGERVMGLTFRLLEMRGPKISAIDERAVALIRGDGMSDRQIDEVAVMLGLLTNACKTSFAELEASRRR